MHTVWMFPGPTAHLPGILAPIAETGFDCAPVLDSIDAVGARTGLGPVSDMLLHGTSGGADSDGHLWLGFLAISRILADWLTDRGVPGDMLVGHSGGEFGALATAGALSVEDAARLMARQGDTATLGITEAGGMATLPMPAEHARQLCAEIGDSLDVAVDNSPHQVVVAGTETELERLETVCATRNIATDRLALRAAYHNRILSRAARRLSAYADTMTFRPPRRRVYSPMLGREIVTAGDARAVARAALVAPVGFRATLCALFDAGARVFLECGAKQVLTGLVGETLPTAAHATPLLPGRMQARAITARISTLVAPRR